MLLLVRRAVAIHIEHFGTEQPDTFRAVGKRAWRFQSGADIRRNINTLVITGIGQLRGSLRLLFLAFIRQRLRDLIITAHRVIRVNRQHAALGVKHCRLPGITGNRIQRQATQYRDRRGTGQNQCMRGAPGFLQNHARKIFQIKAQKLAWG
ncbi:Uncharacterised protein [Shigella sonnei]|nr:Uncharacterised protein [Shigella sonnei]CSG23527.1 Uncharacterised protein [Shigella sonnei]CSQ06581.1 Uncharacterised protein [Shigella sonnei]CSQ68795.1 Uncharacterised protein [Shigella sonnei]CSR40710.1 Uncharacterised protein [Shigella sonnei]